MTRLFGTVLFHMVHRPLVRLESRLRAAAEGSD
jgi:hypothetical protein